VTFRTMAVALVFNAVAFAGALAQDQDGQKPPTDQPAQSESKPAEQPKCVTSKTEWKQNGRDMTFEIELHNDCEMRLQCRIEAFVMGSRGTAQGQGTVLVAPKSKGGAAKPYGLKVKSLGGMANVSHSCKAI
jgi:hypothetical protein